MSQNRTRTHHIHLMLNDSEAATLQSEAAKSGVSRSEYIREAIFPSEASAQKKVDHSEEVKPKDGKRSVRFTFALTEAEAAKLAKRAATSSLTRSEFIRRAVLGSSSDPRPVADASLLRQIYVELRRQGANLNQLTKRINTYGKRAFSESEVASATNAVAEASALLVDVLRK